MGHTVADFLKSDKGRDALLVLTIALVACASFGLGQLSVSHNEPLRPSIVDRSGDSVASVSEAEVATIAPPQGVQEAPITEGSFVASKNGKAYHYPWCPGAKQINEENLITFPSRDSAETAGYTPAGNCKGL